MQNVMLVYDNGQMQERYVHYDAMKRCLCDAWYECIYGHKRPKNYLFLLAHLGVQCPMCAVKKVIYGPFGFPWQKTRPTYNVCITTWCRCAKAQLGDVHNMTISTNNHTAKAYTTFRSTCMAGLKMARNVFAPCPYFRDLQGRELKGFLVIFPKVVISLLMVSIGIIPFEEHIAAVGTTSNNMLSKKKSLDEGSL